MCETEPERWSLLGQVEREQAQHTVPLLMLIAWSEAGGARSGLAPYAQGPLYPVISREPARLTTLLPTSNHTALKPHDQPQHVRPWQHGRRARLACLGVGETQWHCCSSNVLRHEQKLRLFHRDTFFFIQCALASVQVLFLFPCDSHVFEPRGPPSVVHF